MSANTANRARGARSAGRNQPIRPAANQPQNPVAAVWPPPLPAKFAKLIDGTNVTSISVQYSKYGAVVVVCKADGSFVPLERYEAEAKAASADKLFREELDRLRKRAEERRLDGVAVPAGIASKQELEEYLQSLDEATRRLLTMTNREFRAQQGANDQAATA